MITLSYIVNAICNYNAKYDMQATGDNIISYKKILHAPL